MQIKCIIFKYLAIPVDVRIISYIKNNMTLKVVFNTGHCILIYIGSWETDVKINNSGFV